MVSVFLLLGTNLGNRVKYLHDAIKHIAQSIAPVIKMSSVYETQSWGKTEAPDYLNQVIVLQTNITARMILKKILDIEILMGRKRLEKWGPRTIDIDILFYGNEIINEPDLVIPHPELQNRRFTLEPMAELEPHLIHPLLNKNILQLQSELTDNLTVKSYNFDKTLN